MLTLLLDERDDGFSIEASEGPKELGYLIAALRNLFSFFESDLGGIAKIQANWAILSVSLTWIDKKARKAGIKAIFENGLEILAVITFSDEEPHVKFESCIICVLREYEQYLTRWPVDFQKYAGPVHWQILQRSDEYYIRFVLKQANIKRLMILATCAKSGTKAPVWENSENE